MPFSPSIISSNLLWREVFVMDINSISWDSTLLKVQFSNGKVIAFENITFSEYQQLLSCLTAADKPSIEAMLNELEMYHVHHVA